MIYFFDNELNMVKVATSKNVISAVHEHELNGLILGTVETDLSYTEAFINDVDYFGYYYKDNYYLHKIKRVEHEHENELVRITGRHIFFEDMLYGDYIRDVRPVNRDALYILNQTISANTRWQTVMTDTSKLHSETYYWVPPMEVLNDLTENVGIEYEPKILFDGQNINGFQLHVANRIGEDTPIRVPFGSRVLNLKYEVDYSEIVTALYGHGKGEEVGDGYGRRINFSSVNFNRNGVVSPTGQLYMENPNVTAQYGKDDGSPKFGRIIFEDIESASELANATYEAYLEQSRPKMLFEASVVDLGDVGMGDGVLIIRREYDVYFNARIHKLMVDLLDAENADVELGDYAHFKESKVQRKTRESNNQYRRETSSRIQQLKERFNDRFDGEVNQMREDFEQALIDANAEIEAAEQRMTETIGNERASLQEEIDDKTNDAREYADTQIADKEAQYEADWNQRDADIQQTIETVVGGSVDALDTNLLDVNSRLFQTRNDLIERINNIDTQSFNLIRGSRFDEPDRYATSGGTVHDDEDMPYFRYGLSSGNTQYISTVDDIQFEAGETYTLSLDYRTSNDVSIDYLRIIPTDGSSDINIRNNITESDMAGIIPDGEWHRTFLTFTVPRNLTGNLRIGSDFTSGTKAQTDIRLPYLTTSGNTQWVFHPSDSYESIMSIMTRLDEFEARVENDLAGVSAELSTARSELQEQLDDAKAELEGIEYENRNLFVQSSELDRLAEIDDREVLKTRGYFNNSGELASGDPLIIKRDLLSGATYTLSGRFDAPNHPSVPNHNNILLHHENGIINVGKFPPHYENHSFTFRVPENLTQTFLAFDTGVYDAYIEKDTLKLERGKKATPYSKAPEDTEHKITTLNQQIEYIDGELEAKLNRTEIEPIQNKITEYDTTLDANAESIGLLQEKTELHDGDITKWSNITESNAEEIGRTLTRISDIDGNIERAETDIYVNAESIGGLLTRTSEAEQSIADINISVDGFRVEVGTLQGDIDGVDSWIADKGSIIDGNADAISARVWQTDIDAVEVGGRNIIPNSSNLLDWSKWSFNTSVIKMTHGMHRVSRGNSTTGGVIGIHSKGSFVLKAGNEYTISYKAHDFYDALPNYIYILSSEQGNTQLSNLDIKLLGRTGTLVNQSLYANQYKLTFTFTKDVKDGQILIGYSGGTTSHPNIGFYISDVQLEKGNKATDWTPAPEDIQADITQLNTDITIEAGRIDTLLTRASEAEQSIADISLDVDGITADFASYKQDINGEIGQLSGQVASYEASVDGFRAEVGTLQGDINDVDSWIADKGAVIDGTAEAISARVWQSDIDDLDIPRTNLIPNTNFEGYGHSNGLIPEGWVPWRSYQEVFGTNYNGEMLLIRTPNPNDDDRALAIRSPWLIEDYIEGQEYTLSVWLNTFHGAIPEFDYFYIENAGGDNQSLRNPSPKETQIFGNGNVEMTRYEITFTAQFTGRARVIMGGNLSSARYAFFYLREPVLVKGNQYKGYSVSSRDYMQHTDFILQSDGFFLGGNYVGGEHYSTAIVGSKDGIDILADRMRVTGDLIVKDNVESWSMAAVKAEFGSLWADEFEAITITGDHIDGNTITGRHLSVDSAMVDKLIADTAFANDIQTLSLNAVRGDIADLRTRILTSDVVNSTHLNVNAALANKFNANTAFIDRLEVKAANIRDLTGTHIRGGLLDSLNGATRLNLNTGDWTIGGSAKITFTSRNNRLEYSNRGITAGMQFDHSLGSDGRPMTAVGVSDGAFDVNDDTYRGLIVHSLGTEGLLGYGTSLITQSGGFYTRTDRTGSGINFRLHATGSGAPRGIYPQYTGNYDYNLGSALNPWAQAYIRDIRTTEKLWIRDWNGSGGWHVGTIAESGRTTITLRGVSTNLWNYNLGSGTYRMNNIYLLNSPNVSSDKRLKEDIKSTELGLDFINGIEIKSFRKIAKEADINEGRLKNHVEFGLIAQQLRDNLISHGVDTEDIAMLSIDDDGYYGVQHEQLIAPTIKAVQDLDVKVESNTEKIKRLEKEIETLKGA